jgi:general secretion pathway protein J
MISQRDNSITCKMASRRLNAASRNGFTLIELLVAITILAIVAVLGWRGLDGIVRARINLSAQLEQTRGMQLTFAQMQNDCAHIVSSTAVPDRNILMQTEDRLTLVRTVVIDDQPTRLQVVSYRLHDGVLTRRESIATRDLEMLDQLMTTATNDADSSQEVVLLSNVKSMDARAWKPGKGWVAVKDLTSQTIESTSSNPAAPSTDPATGMEVSLLLQGSEVNLTKIFLLGPV